MKILCLHVFTPCFLCVLVQNSENLREVSMFVKEANWDKVFVFKRGSPIAGWAKSLECFFKRGASMAVQWSSLHASNAMGAQVWSLVRELRYDMPHCVAKKKKEGGVYPTRNVRSFTYQLGLPTPCLSYWGRTVRKPSSVVGWWWSSPTWGTHQSVWFQDVELLELYKNPDGGTPTIPTALPDSLNQNLRSIVLVHTFSFKHPSLAGEETLGSHIYAQHTQSPPFSIQDSWSPRTSNRQLLSPGPDLQRQLIKRYSPALPSLF